jgi:dihydrofolate reductase
MAKLISTTAMTVDGVIDVGEWFVSEGGHMDASLALFDDASGLMMGRPTYEGLAGFWPTQEGPWADLLNPMPKYVPSRTLEGPLDWNATAVKGEAEETVPKLKDELDGDIVLTGAGELARSLAVAGLIDEFRFGLHPATVGTGTRVLEGEPIPLELLEATTYDSGVVVLRYAPVSRG